MLIHSREELARMSMYHMARVIKKFNDAGHTCHGIVFGDAVAEPDQFKYALDLGLIPYHIINDPLYLKFRFAWQTALLQQTEYVCKMDSNNVNSEDYWDRCLEKIGGVRVVTFGTPHFLVAHRNIDTEKTRVFTTRKHKHLCNSGQFYLTYSLSKVIDFNKLYKEGQKCNFDGEINILINEKWGDEVTHRLSPAEGLDCVDIKDGTDIHPYASYISRDHYPLGPVRSELGSIYPEVKLLDEGYFALAPDKSAEQEDEPSE